MALPLYEFANISNERKHLKNLAESLAMKEDWSSSKGKYDVLFSYIHHTFIRLSEVETSKIKMTEAKACFSTGLVTDKQESIFALFTKVADPLTNRGKDWLFEGFFKESDNRLNGLRPLPEPANYFTDPADFIYDTRLELACDYDHIIDDNRDRLPQSLSGFSTYFITSNLRGAIDLALRRIKGNYRTAVPHYYRKEIQLLIPICILDPAKADFALAVRKDIGSYVAKTVLDLEMAYNNARLITRPDIYWLK